MPAQRRVGGTPRVTGIATDSSACEGVDPPGVEAGREEIQRIVTEHPGKSEAVLRWPSQNHTVEQLVLESCHSTWVFDIEGKRFRRILKGIEVEEHPVATQWRPYYALECKEDSEAFTVLLNQAGTRLIQSWRHTHDCLQCGGHVTGEISLEEVNAVIGR